MPSDLSFACDCGTVTGTMAVVSGEGDHVVCHCTDCRDLTHYLGQAARVLDAHGGSALYQARCAHMRLDTGRDRLSCLHLTDAQTLRWYAACCRLPLFNTYKNGKLPYITIQLAACDAAARDRFVGPPLGHLFTQDAIGDTGALPKMSMFTLMRRFFVRAIKDIMSGDRRKSALFDAKTLEPIATPHRLTGEERQALNRNRVGPTP